MKDYQQIVDEIRSFLEAADQTLTGRLRELAADYAEACREVNQRLRRCEEFLQRGLRSEAIHLAQAEPDLLDQVAVLDFPDRHRWEEVLLTYSIPAPPKLLLATAEALNEAYAKVQPLEHLLRKHRLLALGRAPLMTRLGVMRQIALLDTGNPVWAEDIGAFEKARIRQLESEIESAQASGDARMLDKLFTEIRTTDWITAPPTHLIERADDLAKRRQRHQVRESMRTLENEIHDAVAACDVERVRRLRARWKEEAARANLSRKDPLWERVAPAFEWLEKQERREAEERQYQTALLELERALRDRAPLEVLQQRYGDLVACGTGIPEDLELRYQARAEELRGIARRRKRLVIGAGAAVAVMVSGWVFFEWRQSKQDTKYKETVRALRKLHEDQEFAAAKKLLDDFEANEPRLAERPDFIPLKQQVLADYNADQLRLERFEKALREMEMAPLDERGKPAAQRAEREARLPDEKKRVQKLLKDREQKLLQLQQQNDRQFRADLDELHNRVQELEQMQTKTPNAPAVREELAVLQDKLQKLRERKGVTSSMRDLLASPAKRLEAVRKSCDLAGRKTELPPPGK